MTTAVLLRSGMMGNYHVPFWRAVKEATPSLTLIIERWFEGIFVPERSEKAVSSTASARARVDKPDNSHVVATVKQEVNTKITHV
ncbi:hypothetical protein QT990_11210 [Microcoleus sp. T3_B1]|uniref:hypothetical protein n=1 Tax=Microcoleus sp. T3_B1 TaxID=3055425 RepID=UPI002FD3CC7E